MSAPLTIALFFALGASRGVAANELSGSELLAQPTAAQARLAEALADADAVDSVTASRHMISFAIDHVGERFTITAFTDPDGNVTAVKIEDAGVEPKAAKHELDWLAREMKGAASVPALVVGETGKVTLSTGDGRHYLVIPDRHDGNSAVEAQWGAEWDNV